MVKRYSNAIFQYRRLPHVQSKFEIVYTINLIIPTVAIPIFTLLILAVWVKLFWWKYVKLHLLRPYYKFRFLAANKIPYLVVNLYRSISIAPSQLISYLTINCFLSLSSSLKRIQTGEIYPGLIWHNTCFVSQSWHVYAIDKLQL